MKRLVAWGICGALASISSGASAEGLSANTVRGKLSVKCAPTGGEYEGRYQYFLAGKSVRPLSSDCSPGVGTSHISIEQVFRSTASTTLLVIEGHTATSQNIRVLHVPRHGPAIVVDALGGDGYALVQKTPIAFRLIAPGGGFALSGDRRSTWTCVIDINFATGRVSGNLAVPYEPGLPRSVCQTELKRVAL